MAKVDWEKFDIILYRSIQMKAGPLLEMPYTDGGEMSRSFSKVDHSHQPWRTKLRTSLIIIPTGTSVFIYILFYNICRLLIPTVHSHLSLYTHHL